MDLPGGTWPQRKKLGRVLVTYVSPQANGNPAHAGVIGRKVYEGTHPEIRFQIYTATANLCGFGPRTRLSKKVYDAIHACYPSTQYIGFVAPNPNVPTCTAPTGRIRESLV
jgi:hypothetical protein